MTLLLLLTLLCLPSSQEKITISDQEGESAGDDPCLYTYKAFQPNLSSVKEKVAFITVNKCQREKQARDRRKKRRQSQRKHGNKDSKLVLKSLETKKSRGKNNKKQRKEKRKRKKKKGTRSEDRRGKVHREFKDWKRFVATKSLKGRERGHQEKSRSLSSPGRGSSKWRKLLRQREEGGRPQPQHISHHLG